MRTILLSMAVLGLSGCSTSDLDADRVAPKDIPNVRLLDCHKLPADASNVYLSEGGFQDADQGIRFDTSLAEARTLAKELLGWPARRGFVPVSRGGRNWWPKTLPKDAEGGDGNYGPSAMDLLQSIGPDGDVSVNTAIPRPISSPGLIIVILPTGDRATMLIKMFGHPSWEAQPCDVKRSPVG